MGSLRCERDHSYACVYTRGVGHSDSESAQLFWHGKTLTNCSGAPVAGGVRASGLPMSRARTVRLTRVWEQNRGLLTPRWARRSTALWRTSSVQQRTSRVPEFLSERTTTTKKNDLESHVLSMEPPRHACDTFRYILPTRTIRYAQIDIQNTPCHSFKYTPNTATIGSHNIHPTNTLGYVQTHSALIACRNGRKNRRTKDKLLFSQRAARYARKHSLHTNNTPECFPHHTERTPVHLCVHSAEVTPCIIQARS